jgi:hypothetical protein
MTALDELIRTSLEATAAEQGQPADLAERSIQLGRQIRRRRKIALSVAAATSVVVLVGGSVAIADAVSHDHRVQTISTAAQPLAKPSVAPWRSWPTDRVFGAKPGSHFFAGLPTSTVYASGTLPDGMEFELFATGESASAMPISDNAGWHESALFGDNPGDGSPLYRSHAPYFAMESMTFDTWDHGREDRGSSQWLIVIGQPGTTSASYSADGTTWQSMQVEDGIAVLKLPTGAPRTAQIQLSEADGQYVDGPLAIL